MTGWALKYALTKAEELQIDLIGLPETNLEWTKRHEKDVLKEFSRSTRVKLEHSAAAIVGRIKKQLEGTATIVRNKWTLMVKARITDKSGLGRSKTLRTHSTPSLSFLLLARVV